MGKIEVVFGVYYVYFFFDFVFEFEDFFVFFFCMQGKEGCLKFYFGFNYEVYVNEWVKIVGFNNDEWWVVKVREIFDWYEDFKIVRVGGFEYGDIQWL